MDDWVQIKVDEYHECIFVSLIIPTYQINVALVLCRSSVKKVQYSDSTVIMTILDINTWTLHLYFHFQTYWNERQNSSFDDWKKS